jgi:hypothetical protein
MFKLQEKATLQETFDFIVDKLREQGKPAYDVENERCFYGQPGGIRCAIGHLMGEGTCDNDWNVTGLVDNRVIEAPSNRDFLYEMQGAHDEAARLDSWGRDSFSAGCARKMIEVASYWEISPVSAQEWLTHAQNQ